MKKQNKKTECFFLVVIVFVVWNTLKFQTRNYKSKTKIDFNIMDLSEYEHILNT